MGVKKQVNCKNWFHGVLLLIGVYLLCDFRLTIKNLFSAWVCPSPKKRDESNSHTLKIIKNEFKKFIKMTR